MLVRRSDVSFRDSIHLESFQTGAKATSASFAGSGPASASLRTKRLRMGVPLCPGRTGFHCEYGTSVEPSRAGPLRADHFRSASSVYSTCFSEFIADHRGAECAIGIHRFGEIVGLDGACGRDRGGVEVGDDRPFLQHLGERTYRLNVIPSCPGVTR